MKLAAMYLKAITVFALLMQGEATESPPVPPDEALLRFSVDPGFAVELVAAEPLVRDPVGIDWGVDGKLWVVEMADYPYGIDGEGQPGGRVRFLEDSNGDGRMDSSTLFLEGLSFPTSVMAWGNGVLVTAAPDILYAEDTDGDGRADYREVLFTGFMEGNQQLRLNSLRWGLDGWIYAASGGHHAGFGAQNRIRVGDQPDAREVALGSGDLRFQPHSLAVERLAGPSQFGRVRDDWGNWFGVQNSYPLWHYVLDEATLRRNPHVTHPDPRRQLRGQQPRVFGNKPSQKRFHGFDHVGRYTSACGPSLYRDDWLFPDEEGLTHAFTCEPFSNLVQHHHVKRKGVSFEGSRAPTTSHTDFLASSDRWCRPVMTRTGPDGALWVVDMYRYMIEHPDWLPEAGREELKPFYRHGDDRGRIYRVVRTGAPRKPIPRFAASTPEEWIERLTSSNGRVRDAAQRLLLQGERPGAREETDRASRLEREALLPKFRDALERARTPQARLQIGATLMALGWDDAGIHRMLQQDPHWAVRRWGLRAGEGLATSAVSDPDAAVRLEAAVRLAASETAEAGLGLVALAQRTDLDDYTVAAILSGVPHHLGAFARVARELKHHEALARGLLSTAAALHQPTPLLLQNLIDGKQPESLDFRLLAHWLDQPSGGDEREWNRWQAVLKRARDSVSDEVADPERRLAALQLLGREPGRWGEERALLAKCVKPQVSSEIQLAGIRALQRSRQSDVPEWLLERWPNLSPMLRGTVVDVLLDYGPWRGFLLQALQKGRLHGRDLSLSQRERLRKREPSAAAWLTLPPSREEALRDHAGALKLEGAPQRGRPIFLERCVLCHRVGEEGTNIGPDLRALTNRSAEAVYAAILDPNRAVEPLYLAYTATTRSGEVIYGVLKGETGNTVTLAQLDGRERALRRSDLAAFEGSGRSLMPEGLESDLSDQGLADLIAFVRTLK